MTAKLAMLLALVLAHRASDLVCLSIVGVNYLPHAVSIPLHGLAKQTRPGNQDSTKPVMVSSLESDQRLCPVACYKEYVLRTSVLRASTHSHVFISVVKPHKPVVSSTISRWIKGVLRASGVDVSHYTAHSTRGTATSVAAKAGISTQEIMERAGW